MGIFCKDYLVLPPFELGFLGAKLPGFFCGALHEELGLDDEAVPRPSFLWTGFCGVAARGDHPHCLGGLPCPHLPCCFGGLFVKFVFGNG